MNCLKVFLCNFGSWLARIPVEDVDVGLVVLDRRPVLQGEFLRLVKGQCCQMAKFDPFLSLDCVRVEGGGRNPRKGRDQILQRSVAEP